MAFVTNPNKLKTRFLVVKITLTQDKFIVNNEDVGNVLVLNENQDADNPSSFFTVNVSLNQLMTTNLSQTADVVIYGLGEDLINQLSTLGYVLDYNFNKIQIFAGYDQDVDNLIFSGYIIKSWAQLADPNRPLNLQCSTNYLMQLENPEATNPQGNTSVVKLFNSLADSAGFGLINNGVTGDIESPILVGSYPEQIKSLAKQTNTIFGINNNILSIAPAGQALSTNVYDLDYTSGMLGYPVIDQWGIRVRMRFNPLILLGQYVNVVSKVPKATGKWYIYSIASELNNRHESWFSELRLSNNQNFTQATG